MIESGASIREQLGETWVYAVDAALSPVALAVAYETDSHPALVLGLVPMLGVLAGSRASAELVESIVELKNAYYGTALVLGDVVEADDAYTGEHCKGVVQLTLAVADELGLDAERRATSSSARCCTTSARSRSPRRSSTSRGGWTPTSGG